MSESTGHDCGHVCCDERTDPHHDHFLSPEDCPACKRHAQYPHGHLVEQVHRVITTDQGDDPWVVAEAIVDVVQKRTREAFARAAATVTPEPGTAQHVGDSDQGGRPFRELMDSGLLWLINASVFHPRGLAMSISVDQATGEAGGWSLLSAAAGEAFRYAVPCELDDPSKAVDVDELFRRASTTMRGARLQLWGADDATAAPE